MKKLSIIAALLFTNMSILQLYASAPLDAKKPKITNNSSSTINIVFYTGTPKDKYDRQFRINDTGYLIGPGAFINYPSGTSIGAMAMYYGSKDPIIKAISSSKSYTIYPSSDVWTIEAD